MVTIRDAMIDPVLFGETFAGPSFAAWRALLSGFYGLPLADDEAQSFLALTGRAETPTEAHDELWLVVGRRGGKSHAAALVGVYEAAFRDHRSKLAPGEVATVMLVAADRQQARTLLRYVRGMCDHPMIRPMVLRETETGIELSNRCAIEVGTASFRSVRGYTIAAAICDEVAFWQSEGASPDAEIIAALRPALATLGGKLVCLSSPYARRGVLWDAHRQHFGKDGRVLVAQAPSRTMNPTLPQRVIDDAIKDDAARASAEYLAQFRSDIEAFLSVAAVADAQRAKPADLPRVDGASYRGFVDMSGGGADEHTLAIAHKDGARIVVDLVHGRRGDPEAAVAAFAETLKAYGIGKVHGDRYAGAWVPTAFQRHGIAYDAGTGTRSELYASFAPALNAGQVELPPCEIMAKQLSALERRTARGGRDLIDHPPGGHDDRANAVAGAVRLCLTVGTVEFVVLGDEPLRDANEFVPGVWDRFPATGPLGWVQ
jgi:phage terminase large subunit-like protein